MTLLQAIISGLVQGVTEFLPISSSGHLVILHSFFNIQDANVFFDVCLHAGTLLAVIVYFWKDIVSIIVERKFLWIMAIIVGTIPAGITVLFFEEKIDMLFTDPKHVALMLIFTGMMLFAANIKLKKREGNKELSMSNSFLVGIAQAVALFPGISRSGSTISIGLLSGVKPDTAFKFSFLLSIPAILGAVILKSMEQLGDKAVLVKSAGVYIAGMFTAFIVGIACLPLLSRVVRKKQLNIFGIYCLCVGLLYIFIKK